jgi:L-ascorbate metabolism protein UlaG (beta-lactamase superfamily)
VLRLRWLNTAAFEIYLGQAFILFDSYLARNTQARPVLMLCPAEVTRADFILPTARR